ncbi:MAG: DUF4209 domain-containing protein [Ignavibacteriales bacterium]|nr:DUF4209 domain-containing protein [Ignavibacteriales bacterium]
MTIENNDKILPLTVQDFKSSNWKEILGRAKKRDCFDYNSLFLAEAREAEDKGQKVRHLVCRLLADITSLHLKSENSKEPFGPLIVMEGKRSAIVKDFSDDQLSLLKGALPEIDDPELRSRVADVLWLRKRDYKDAEIAIESYIESAKILEDPNQWTHTFHRIERAFRLAALLGDATRKFEDVVKHIEDVLNKYDAEDPLHLSQKLMSLLCERRVGDPVKYGKLAEKAAKNSEEAHNWLRAQIYWQRKAEWDRIAKNEESQKKSLACAAETYVRMAEATLIGGRPSYMLASTHLNKAIEAYRRIGGMNERIDELHKLLLDYEQKSIKEFGVISSPSIDLTKTIEDARKSVKGKKLIEALFILSQGFRIQTIQELRKHVEDSVKQAPLASMISGVIVNNKGKVIGKRPGLLLEEGDEYEKALRPHMFQEAKLGYSIDVQALIDPMRRQIEIEHYLTIDDLGPIVLNNPLIPQYREDLYARGLLSGLQGDFVTAIHLIVPQFENSVRYLLEQQGVLVSGLDDEGIQEEYDLNKLLYHSQIKTTFGEDLLFHLQGLLVEKEGANMRNRMAHGLMYPGEFYSPDCIYLWALILHLCCWPSIAKLYGTPKEEDEGTNNQSR